MLNVTGLKSPNTPFAETDLIEVQRALGIKLPAAYVELMKIWNGGYLRPSYEVPLKGNVPAELDYYLRDGFWGINSIAGIVTDSKSAHSIFDAAKLAHEEWGIPKKVIPIDGDGHTWVALDYRNKPEPEVVFFATDEKQSFVLAGNFDDFIMRLIPYDEVFDRDGNVIYAP
jgi:hypothetical protein